MSRRQGLALVMIALLSGAKLVRAQQTIPTVTLAQALRRATQLDPDYVRALGQVDNAEWGRRAARLAFLVPSLSAQLDATKYSAEFFNIGTLQPQSSSVTATVGASYEVFRFAKFTDLSATRAELESSQASELQQRLRTAFLIESDYYGVLANQALHRVASERLRRADQQLTVGRARVVSGAAVQSDSLQLTVEATRARIDLTRTEAGLLVAQLELGRRVGERGPLAAAAPDSVPPPELPVALPEAVTEALERGPQYRAARAGERRANALLRGARGQYLPSVTLSGANQTFDSKFFPTARNISSLTLTVSWPLWDLGQREIAVTQARVNRDVSRAIRQDLERGAQRDVTEAYEAYRTARATVDLSRSALAAAAENFRVQEARYRSGATTIVELLDSQTNLTQAEADVVQADYSTRLALAGLEVIIGRRLFPSKDVP
ncbi:MAG TPA: TolC family protein [Gemmatimonadales bacterium]|nr:TolC family protein [Gemmatimonadales bacterium]